MTALVRAVRFAHHVGVVDRPGVGRDVGEDRRALAVLDRRCGGHERLAGNDHFVAGTDADGVEHDLQRDGTVGDRFGPRDADQRGKLRLEVAR